jgi:phosphate/sulfate permease
MKLVFCGSEWGNMKKIVLGMLIGIGLSLGVTVYADDIISLIGKKVDGSGLPSIHNTCDIM